MVHFIYSTPKFQFIYAIHVLTHLQKDTIVELQRDLHRLRLCQLFSWLHYIFKGSGKTYQKLKFVISYWIFTQAKLLFDRLEF